MTSTFEHIGTQEDVHALRRRVGQSAWNASVMDYGILQPSNQKKVADLIEQLKREEAGELSEQKPLSDADLDNFDNGYNP